MSRAQDHRPGTNRPAEARRDARETAASPPAAHPAIHSVEDPSAAEFVSGDASPTTLVLFGIPFHDVTEDETLAWIAARARAGRPAQLVTSNLDFILQGWTDPEMHRIHFEADLVLADGWPPVWFSRLFGPRLKARVAGADLVPRLGAVARTHDLSLYALGGMPGVGETAMRILQERHPGLRVAGCASPPMAPLAEMDHDGMRRALREARPDILLVAFGAPKQDKWIRMNALPSGVPVAMGVGGSLDFIAGTQYRAPRWIQKFGMEWFWRLARQPRRLFKRYASNAAFLGMMLVRLALIRVSSGHRAGSPPLLDPALLRSSGAVVVELPPLATPGDASAFCRLHGRTASERLVILDLSRCAWLSSLELGAVARLARDARRSGRRLFLTGLSTRVRRLISLFRLERYVEAPDSAAAWARRLEAMAEPRATGWHLADGALEVTLPEEFERDEAWRAVDEFARWERDSAVRSVVVDGGQLRYIDSSGLRFLRTVWLVLGRGGGVMTLRSFPEPILGILRREGLGAIPTDRRG